MNASKIVKPSGQAILRTDAALTITVLTVVLFLVCSTPDLHELRANGIYYLCINGIKEGVCCGLASEILRKYLKKAIDTNFEELEEERKLRVTDLDNASKIKLQRMLEERYWDMKPFARLTGVPVKKPKIYELTDNHQKVRQWQDGRGFISYEVFLQNGITYRNGNVIVTLSGIYHIYSNIHLQAPYVKGVGCPNITESNILKHAIYRFNILDGKDETELTSKTHMPKSPYRDEFRCSFYHSYIDAIQFLNAGDEISVFVNNLTFLVYPEMNYFGVTMV